MPEVYFSNVLLQDNVCYFLYIGELKNYSLNITGDAVPRYIATAGRKIPLY